MIWATFCMRTGRVILAGERMLQRDINKKQLMWCLLSEFFSVRSLFSHTIYILLNINHKTTKSKITEYVIKMKTMSISHPIYILLNINHKTTKSEITEYVIKINTMSISHPITIDAQQDL